MGEKVAYKPNRRKNEDSVDGGGRTCPHDEQVRPPTVVLAPQIEQMDPEDAVLLTVLLILAALPAVSARRCKARFCSRSMPSRRNTT